MTRLTAGCAGPVWNDTRYYSVSYPQDAGIQSPRTAKPKSPRKNLVSGRFFRYYARPFFPGPAQTGVRGKGIEWMIERLNN